MSMFDADQKEMLEVYMLETSDLFGQLDEILLASEKEGGFSREDINSIFRIMHTTKSSSSMMGLEGIASLTHKAEDLFSILREYPEKIEGRENKTFELLFDISDFIKKQIEYMNEDNYEPDGVEQYLLRTQELVELIEVKGGAPVPEPVVLDEAEKPVQEAVCVRIQFETDCKMENIRAYMIATQLVHSCNNIEYYPKDLETDSSACEFIKKSGFYLRFESDTSEAVMEQLKHSLYVSECKLISQSQFLNCLQENKKGPKTISAPEKSETDKSSLIQVQTEKLDELQNIAGELMISHSALLIKLEEKGHKDIAEEMENEIGKLLDELGQIIISVRMVPISGILPKIKRVVRDIAHKEKKAVVLTVIGEEVEIDKRIVDNLFEPLMHILRNAVDHGIESNEERETAGKPLTAAIELEVKNAGGEITISITDDGKGLDREKILSKAEERNLLVKSPKEYSDHEIYSLILLPGFSTVQKATEYSGRGVGLDVVKKMVDQFGGHLSLESIPGEQSRFTLHLPLTLTLIDCLLFGIRDYVFTLPIHNIQQFFAYEREDPNLQIENGHKIYLYNNQVLPVFSLNDLYELEGEDPKGGILIHIKSPSYEACLLVDQIFGYQAVVDKSLPVLLGSSFKKNTGMSGCSLMGDGGICMMLDAEYLLALGLKEEARHE